MAKDKSHEIQRPIPQRENEKLRANLSAPNITNPNNYPHKLTIIRSIKVRSFF